MTELKAGNVQKGGVNEAPTMPKPAGAPVGQGGTELRALRCFYKQVSRAFREAPDYLELNDAVESAIKDFQDEVKET